ncbi:MAG TPA: type II toxin-antitoxin system VapC family toxin [Thermoanaerobaculia bacterium]|jgi:tRNA(fMet)-specific endonuclease VapC|nr:type II toxin-antitoxin system VapC family toxin [Thermoanaerobaculia bacterium]
MRYLLDTNACVDYLTGRFPAVTERIRESPPEDLCISSVVVAELRFGADRSSSRERNHQRLDVLTAEIACADFDLAAAAAYGRVRAALEARGTPIGANDMLIAAQALALGLILVSDNLREFQRVDGLVVESWR